MVLLTKTILLITLVFLNHVYQGRSFKRAPSVYFSPLKYEYFHMGFKSVIADSLWLRILPDVDTIVPRKEGKQYSWQYEMINTVIQLAPTFRAAYRNGGEILSVVVNDRAGAKNIFEKGIERFPSYWPIQYSAAFHYMEFEKNPQRAAELLLLAHKNGGPTWFVSLAGKLYSESGKRELAAAVLIDFLKRNPEGKGSDRAILRLKELGIDPKPYLQ
jgi:hypothetical protein